MAEGKPASSAGAGPAIEPRLSGVVSAGGAAALLFGGGSLVPALGLVSSLPLAIQRVRGGGSAWLAAVLASALLATAGSPELTLSFVFVHALPGLLLGEAVARGRGLLRGCGWAFALLTVEVVGALLFARDRIATWTLAPLDAVGSEAFLAQLRSAGWPPERIAALTEFFADLRRALAALLPAVLTVCSALLVLLNAAVLRLYLLRRDPGWLDDGEFERVRFPFALVPAFVLAGAAVAVPAARPAAYNVLLIVAFFFSLQGLAIVAFYTRRLAAPPLLRALLLLLVLGNPWSWKALLPLVGLLDNWFALRRFAEPKPAGE
jgi:hypothetical protein